MRNSEDLLINGLTKINLKPIYLLTKNLGLNLVELQIKCKTNSIKLIQFLYE
jgi:hypothetical protein